MDSSCSDTTRKIHVRGGVPLRGTVAIQGSKNASLPIMAAALLTEGKNLLIGCPRITDVERMLQLLKSLGAGIRICAGGILIDTSNSTCCRMPENAITGMRSSLCMLGVLLARFGKVAMEYPGGCVIGKRPIDYHIDALEQMGVVFVREENTITGVAPDGLHGARIQLPFPSVGATENIILAAVCAKGRTIIEGAAAEPEVGALCGYLNAAGAKIRGIDTDRLIIDGTDRLHAVTYEIPSDRIVAGTYLLATLATGGSVLLRRAPAEHMGSVLELASQMGAEYQETCQGIYIQAGKPVRSIPYIETQIYPGFPTDLQSVLLAVLSGTEGEAVIEENIFENRFRVVEELGRMGAVIDRESAHRVTVRGTELRAARVTAEELRGGAALVVAGLMAKGETVIDGIEYIERGYENICRDLLKLGARIYCDTTG